jgi:hypothetical protein
VTFWTCRCECGVVNDYRHGDLRNGRTTSCGCARRQINAAAATKHGHCFTPEYEVWKGMKARCYNRNHIYYARYGGRGITVCDAWRNNFPAFLRDMGQRPSPHHSIERNDNDRPYEPSNCRWATVAEQGSNTTRCRRVTHHGKTQSMLAWAKELGVPYQSLRRRIAAGLAIADIVR